MSKYKKKFSNIALALLMLIGNGSQPLSVMAETPVDTLVPESTSVPSEAPVNSVVPENSAPAESSVPEGTTVPSESPNTTKVPTETPTETQIPTDTEVPSETTVPSEEPLKTEAPATTEATDKASAEEGEAEENKPSGSEAQFEQASLEDINARIDLGEKLIILAGNDDDPAYKATKDAYYEIYLTFDQQVQVHFLELDESTINDEQESIFLESTINADDKKALENCLSALKESNNENAVLLKTSNKKISKVDTVYELDGKDGNTYEQFVRQHIAMSYSQLLNQTNDQIALYKGPADHEGLFWDFEAEEEKIQSFTAPYEGYYHIELWGADGDSDLGANAVGANSGTYTSGIGGQAGTTEGDIYLKAGETIYLGLGFRNDMKGRPGYNGGGAGWPLALYGARSGGGDAGAIYKTERGMGRLIDYVDHKEDIIMVAGGGGGAEDYFATGEQNYYCNTHSCINSRGGNGGPNPTGGTSQGAIGQGAAFQFGMGQNYASSNNSSSGGGGAGWVGGTAGHDDSLQTRGGSGGGGSSYINTDVIENGTMENGDGLNWNWNYEGQWGWDDGRNAGAKITFKQAKQVKLTVNYYDVNTNEKIAESHEEMVAYGDEYSVPSPDVIGYSLVNEDEETITGTMPDHDVVIDVYYDYSTIKIHYLDYYTKEVLALMYKEHMKTGLPYDVISPDIDGYVRFESNQDHVSGTKLDHAEEYFVYYVPVFGPTKHIVALNGRPISSASDEAGVELKTGDIVTYEIRYKNNRNVEVTETFSDVLSKKVFEYVGNTVGEAPKVTESADATTLEWTITIAPNGEGSLRFDAKVIDTDTTHDTVDNWTRKDPFVHYEVTKSSNPEDGAYVGFEEEIKYTLSVRNNGMNPVHNIVVTDVIPENTEYVTVNHENNGTYHKDGNYVSFVIDELSAGQIKKLEFTVKVTSRIEDDTIIDITNVAHYDNYDREVETNDIEDVKENGNPTNETTHHVIGPKIDIIKDSNPVHLSRVNKGDIIEYSVDLINNGTVKSNFIRVTDDIPAGTTYVENSLSFVSENNDANNKYAVSHGDNFDIQFDFKTGQYYLTNVTVPQLSGTQKLYRVTYEVEEWVKKTGSVGNFEWGSNKQDNYTGTWYPRWGNFGFTARNVKGWIRGEISPVNENVEKYSGNPADRIRINCSSLVSPANYTESTGTINFVTDSTPITSIVGELYQGNLRTGSGIDENKYWMYENMEWRITEWEQLVKTQKTTDWQTSKEAPDGATVVSVEEKTASMTGSELKVTMADGMKIVQSSLPSGWSISSDNGTVVTLKYTQSIDNATAKTLMESIRFEGTYGTIGSIQFDIMTTNKTDFTSTTKSGEFTAPVTGIYKLEAWGADGGSPYTTGGGGAGGYVSGEIELTNGQKIYSVTGARGWGNMGWSAGSIEARRAHNGGGVQQYEGAGGGGATHFATTNRGVLKDYNNYRDEVLLVAGAGGGSFSGGGGNSGSGGAGFGQGSDSCRTAGGGGGWTGGGCDGRGGTNYISPSMSNTSQQNGVSRSGSVRITLVSYDEMTNNVSMRTELPTPENGGSCKFVTDNGTPYVECITNDLEVGQKATMNFKVKVNDDTVLKRIENTAMFETYWQDQGLAGTQKDKPTKPSNTIIHTLQGEMKINAVKSSDPVSGTAVATRDEIRYTIAVTNTGDEDIPYTIVRDTIPEGTTYLGNSADNGGVYVNDYIEWVLTDLKAGETRNVSFSVNVGKNLPDGFIIYNYADYGFRIEDPGKAGDAVVDKLEYSTNKVEHPLLKDTPPVYPLDPVVEVTKSSDPISGTTVKRGDEIQYMLTVSNTGMSTARNILVKDFVPEGTTLKSLDIYEGGNGSPKLIVNEFQAEDGTYLEWQLDGLMVNDSVTLKYTVTVDKETELKLIQNIADWHWNKSDDNMDDYVVGQIDPNTYDKQTNLVEHPLEDPVIKAEKSADPESGSVVAHGKSIHYTINVTNDSEVLANYVNVIDPIPTETTFVENSVILSNVNDSSAYNAKENRIEVTLKDMEPHETRTITFEVKVNKDVRDGDYIYNTAYFDFSHKLKGEPGTDEYEVPTTPTNTTIHTVEILVDVIETGGTGWNKTIAGIGASLVVAGAALVLYRKKRKDIK